jgi:hypothetical protein
MVTYLFGFLSYYTMLFLMLPFIVDSRYLKLCVGYALVMTIDQNITPYIKSNIPDYFFLTRCGLDMLWLLVTSFVVKGRVRVLLGIAISLSLFVNIYNHFDISVQPLYTYWVYINSVLFEIIIAILLSTSPWYKKLNTWLTKLANDMTNKINIKRISLCEEK